MEWRDDGIIIGGRRYGETSLILEVMTRRHGRHLGLVKGGRGKRMAPLVQPGNEVETTWRARLDEHLGSFSIETTRLRAAELMGAPVTLHGLNLVLAHLRLLPEREPHDSLYAVAVALLDCLERPEIAAGLLIRFELALLAECGFGLDLEQCAATGQRDDLVYVSPKSARAVSRSAGQPYKDRLLPLPGFLRVGLSDPEVSAPISPAELGDGFRLTGYFLDRNLFAARGLDMPAARDAYIALVTRAATARIETVV